MKDEMIKLALQQLEELDENGEDLPDDAAVELALQRDAPRVAKAAARFGLPTDVAAAMALAIALSHFVNFAYAFVDYGEEEKVVKAMEALGYKHVEDRCVGEHIERVLAAGWPTAEKVLEANAESYVVIGLPHRALVFEKPEEGE